MPCEHLDNCLLCEACTNVCPARGADGEHGHRVPRDTLATSKRKTPPLAARLAFAWLFGDLGNFRLLGRLIWFYQRSGVQWLARHSASCGCSAWPGWSPCCRPYRHASSCPRARPTGQG